MKKLTTKPGWGTPARDYEKAFVRINGRVPDDNEIAMIARQIVYTNQGVVAGNETQFQAGHLLVQHIVKNGRFPNKKQLAALNAKAVQIVQGHIADYHRAHRGVGDFFSDVAKTAGAVAHSAIHAASTVTGAVTDIVGKIPIVGAPLHAVFDAALAAPFGMADSIASGQRIDKAVLGNLSRTVNDVKEVAPYVQTVVSVIPGAGNLISGALGTTLALASGHNITESLADGVESAVPGGPVVKSVCSVSRAVLAGKPIDQIALSAIPLPEDTKKILGKGLILTKAIASGQNVPKLVISEAYDALPSEAKKAVDIAREAGKNPAMAVANATIGVLPKDLQKAVKVGVAVGGAQNLQKLKEIAATSDGTILKLQEAGGKISSPVMSAARGLIKDPTGFNIGAGLMTHGHVDVKTIKGIRERLKTGDERKGFDLALATHVGLVTRKPVKASPKAQAGYYATLGMMRATDKQKIGMLKAVVKDPQAKKGVKVAARKIQKARLSWWRRFKQYVGLEKAA